MPTLNQSLEGNSGGCFRLGNFLSWKLLVTPHQLRSTGIHVWNFNSGLPLAHCMNYILFYNSTLF